MALYQNFGEGILLINMLFIMDAIEKLNSETLFFIRKQYGMYGNIQWAVTELDGKSIKIRVSSSTEFDDEKKLSIPGNIARNVKDVLPDYDVSVEWQEWKSEHGSGGLVRVAGRSAEQVKEDLARVLDIDEI